MNRTSVLITISGKDHPGITAQVMSCINEAGAELEDIEQSIIHGLLSLSILLRPIDEFEGSKLLRDLLLTVNKMDVKLDYKIIKDLKQLDKKGEKYILSCVSLTGITANFFKDIATTLANNDINILDIVKVSNENLVALDITTLAQTTTVDWDKVKTDLILTSNKHSTDMALIKDNVWRRNKRLIVFDMDSTLIQSEVIVEMAKQYGVGDKVHEITELAMNGKVDFDESLKRRVSLLKGMKESELIEIRKKIKLTAGVEDFITTVKKLGYKTAIISGGFNYFADKLKDDLGIDYSFSNELEISNGLLTGNVSGPIINAEKKAMLIELIGQQEGINLEQVVAIGDGANDLQMLAKAGLGIAFHAKDIVKKTAQQHMSHGPMTSILYFLGITNLET